MKNILVAGAGGFIGGFLVRRLLEEGHTVVAADIKPRQEWWQIHPCVNYANMDLRDPQKCEQACQGIDEVYNLACSMGGMGFIANNRIECLHNINIISNLIKFAFENGVRRFFQSSSACVYNDNLQQTEVVYLKEGDAWPALPEPCLSSDTEVMTQNGFKPIHSVTKDDYIATLNTRGIFEYQKPTAIQKIAYKGEMIRFKSKYYDCLVTPGHHVFAGDSRTSKFERITAEKFIAKSNFTVGYFKRNCEWGGSCDVNEVIFESCPYDGEKEYKVGNRTKAGFSLPIDGYLDFLGWYISEGHCGFYGGKDYLVSIRQCKKDGIKKIKDLCDSLPLKYSFSDHEGGRFKFHSKILWSHFKNFGTGAANKFLPDWVLNLPKEKLQILYSSMMAGDGSFHDTSREYYTSSPKLRDQFIEICLKLGKACSIRAERLNENSGNINYVIGISEEHLTHKVTKDNISVEDYDGFVYDFTVPNHVFYIRRNGKHLWTGNCYGLEKLYGEEFCLWYRKELGFETRIARYHNVFGPVGSFDGGREKAPAAICRKVIAAKLSGKHEIEIWGDGNQTRSFMYIDDCIEGTRRLMDSNFKDPLNIGSSRFVTINQLVDIAENIAGIKLTRNYNLNAPVGVRGRSSDNTLVKEVLDWEPVISLETGLESTYKWIYDQMVKS